MYIEDDGTLHNLLTEQVTSLTIDVNDQTTPGPCPASLSTIFALILSLSKRLIKLNFGHFYHRSALFTFQFSSIDCNSSTLTTLKINVENFDDCLYLLDGRLSSLSTFTVYVDGPVLTSETIDNKVSITSNFCTSRKEIN